MPGFGNGSLGVDIGMPGFSRANLGSSTRTLGNPFMELGMFGLSQLSADLDARRKRKLMEYQYEKNLEQWKRQNEYDSPAAQMARLRAAGLNPDLIYGELSNGAGMSQTMSDMDVGRSDAAGAVVKGVQARLQQEQVELNRASVESQIDVNESIARKNDADAQSKLMLAKKYERWISSQDIVDDLRKSNINVNEQQAVVLSNRVNEINAHIRLMDADVLLKDAQREILEIDKLFKSDWWKSEIRRNNAAAALDYKEVERLEQVITELKESWSTRFATMRHEERVNYGKEVMAMAEAAVKRSFYTLNEDGNPVPTKGAAAYTALDMTLSLLGKVLHINIGRSWSDAESYNVNRNDFYNHSSYESTTRQYKGGSTTTHQGQ